MSFDQPRLIEVIRLARELDWVLPAEGSLKRLGYPLMCMSEVEKVMIAFVDDFEMARLVLWVEQKKNAAVTFNSCLEKVKNIYWVKPK